MSIRIVNLGSSSQGNCTYYQFGETHFLVDAGLTGKQIELRLYEIGVDPKKIGSILLTHEHNDHCQGLKGFRRKFPKVEVFANPATIHAMGADATTFRTFRSGSWFKVNGCRLISGAFRVPHTAAEAVGFEFFYEDFKAIHLTDLGHVDDALVNRMAECRAVLIESNYDPELLEKNQALRPFETHKRNQGRTGHLANRETGEALRRARDLTFNVQSDWCPSIGLLHLSRQFNTPDLALSTVRSLCELENIRLTGESRPVVIHES